MTLEADYAVRIVELLASAENRVDAHSISEEAHVPLRFALKILRRLVGDGMVASFKGARGGYTLARGAKEITLRQVIESVEGPYMISRCQQNEYCCTHTSCKFHAIYNEVSDMVRSKLDSYDFASLCGVEDSKNKKEKEEIKH